MSTHQQSKPRRANQSITEESARPGTSRSKAGCEAIDEPCTNSTTGLPAAEPTNFCHRNRRTLPLRVQCSTPTTRGALVSFTMRPLRFAVERRLQLGDVELHHLQHGIAGALDLGLIGVGHHPVPDLRDDLPRHAVAVLEPAAGFRL